MTETYAGVKLYRSQILLEYIYKADILISRNVNIIIGV